MRKGEKNNKILAQLQYNGTTDDLAMLDELAADNELAEEFDGMRLYDPNWPDEFIDYIAALYGEAIGIGLSEEEAIEEVASQEGYTPEEIRSILEEGSARLQDSIMPEE